MKEVSFQESKFVEKFTIFASKMGNEIHLRSLRDAFATIMPLYILAGLAVLINNTVFVWLLSGDTLTGAQYWGTVITNGTLNISSLLIAPVIGYCLSRNKGFDNPMAAAIVSLAALVVMMPNVVSVTPLEGGESVAVSGALTFGNVGTQAMFAGVIIGLIATELFVWISGIKKLQIDLGDSIPPSVGKSFNVLIPFILLLSGFGLISAVLNNVFDTNLIQMITTLIQEPLRTVTTGLVGCVILYSLGNFLWLLGIHQSVIYSSILEPLLIVNMTQNMQVPAKITQMLLTVSDNKYVVLILINILLLVLGCFMDVAPLILIVTPILLPVVKALGMDPIHFGIVIMMNLAVGSLTPPVGTTLFAGCAVGDIPIEKATKALLPYYAVMVVALLLVTYIPAFSMTLPNLLMH